MLNVEYDLEHKTSQSKHAQKLAQEIKMASHVRQERVL